jgi:cytochrome P450
MVTFNPNDPALQRDPYETYRQLRDRYPLYHNPDLDFWVLSRHGDVSAAWFDSETYSSDHGPTIEEWGPDAVRTVGFVAMDPPQHTDMRKLIKHGFAPARIAQLEPRIRQITRDHLGPVLELAGPFDFVGFAASIVVDVISELIGVPKRDRPLLSRLSQQIMSRDDLQGRITPAVIEASRSLMRYYAELIEERRRQPCDDVATALLQAEIEGKRLSDGDVIATLMLLGVAGNETTIKLLGTAWRCGWEHPGQRELVWSGDITISSWVEETLRYEGPSLYLARRATRPVEWYGQVVPADARVLLLPGSGNRDERVFPNADHFDMARDTGRTLAFGYGPHFCLGASLARLEARVVLEELTRVVRPDYDVDMDAASWTVSPTVRGHACLPTTIKPR